MPSAKTIDDRPSISRTTVIMAPMPNRMYATGWPLMKPSTIAFSADACGATSTCRMSPGAASPNWKALASSTIVRPRGDRRGGYRR